MEEWGHAVKKKEMTTGQNGGEKKKNIIRKRKLIYTP